MKALANGNFKMDVYEHSRVRIDVDNALALDAPVSPYIVGLSPETINFYESTTSAFVTALQRIGGQYHGLVSEGYLEHPLVKLLEKPVPEALLPVVRKQAPNLNFTRLDFHGRKIIEYNSSPGFMVLTSIINRSVKKQVVAGEQAMRDASPFANAAGSLILDRVLRSEASGPEPTIAILDRLAERPTNIYGELEYLARIGRREDSEIIFPASSDDFSYVDGGLIHEGTNTAVDVVHLAASEGEEFGRWAALAGSPIFQAYLEGAVEIWPQPANALMTSKFVLAFLSDPAYEGIFDLLPEERDALQNPLPTTRILDADQAQTAKEAINEGQTIVIKPSNGSGGRNVHILSKNSSNYSNKINRAVRAGNFVLMDFCAAPTINASLRFTSDVVSFLNRDGKVDPDAFVHTSRIFEGKKVNMSSDGGGMASVKRTI